MVANHDALHAGLYGQAGVVDVLDALQHDRAVPVFLEEGELVPGVRGAVEDGALPFLGGEDGVRFWGFAWVVFGEAGAEDGVGEADLVADAGGEGDVGVVEVGGAPGQAPGVEGDDQDGVVVLFGAGEERDGDGVVVRPVELVPAHTGAVGVGDFFDAAGRGGREGVGDADFGGLFGYADFFVLVEDALYAYWGEEEGGGELLAEELGVEVAGEFGWTEHSRDDLIERIALVS